MSSDSNLTLAKILNLVRFFYLPLWNFVDRMVHGRVAALACSQ